MTSFNNCSTIYASQLKTNSILDVLCALKFLESKEAIAESQTNLRGDRGSSARVVEAECAAKEVERLHGAELLLVVDKCTGGHVLVALEAHIRVGQTRLADECGDVVRVARRLVWRVEDEVQMLRGLRQIRIRRRGGACRRFV